MTPPGAARRRIAPRRIALLTAATAGLGAAAALGAFGAFCVCAPGPGPRAIPPAGAAAPPPERKAHVAILGTSLTARGDWPEALAARLSRCRAAGVGVRRVARPGANSRWGLSRLSEALSPEDAPAADILIVEYAINDASLYRGLARFRSREQHEAMLERAAATPVFLATMNPAWGWKAVARPGLGAYYALYRELAAERGAGLIDVAAEWRRLAPGALERLAPDGLHPTPEAMRRVALPLFERALRPLVCDPEDARPGGAPDASDRRRPP